MWLAAEAPVAHTTARAWGGIRRLIEAIADEFNLTQISRSDERLILLSDGATPEAQTGVDEVEEMIHAIRQIRSGSKSGTVRSDFAVESLKMVLSTNADGLTRADVDLTVRNTSTRPRRAIEIAVYGDLDDAPPSAEVSFGRRRTTVVADPWTAEDGGFFVVDFPRAVPPGVPLRFSYSYTQRSVVGDVGAPWFEHFVGRIHHNWLLEWTWDQSWALTNVRTTAVDPGGFVPEAEHVGQHIRWKLTQPVPSKRYRLDFVARLRTSAAV